jgi:hypothetical protein
MSVAIPISHDVISHLTGEVMVITSVRLSDARASIARSAGAAYEPQTGHVQLFISGSQWSETTNAATAGKLIAATFTRPENYVSYQLKGRIVTTEPADEDGNAYARAYVERTLKVMNQLGVTRLQLSHTFATHDLIRITFCPLEIFTQSPGPLAGTSLTQARA